MTVLLDANVLIAVASVSHVHHEPAEVWFQRTSGSFATCPITQGALIRTVLRGGGSVSDALASLASFHHHEGHLFWPDAVDYQAVALDGVVGHRQVTDAYLAGLARSNDGSLATFDRGLAALHPDVAVLVPVMAEPGSPT